MVRNQKPRYSEKTINEVIALYESGEQISEINRTYNLQDTTIYHFLKSRGITPRSKRNGTVEPEVPGSNFTHGVVTTDKEGWVIDANRKGITFEIEFAGTIEIVASSIEEAIALTRKRSLVSRIFSVKEKS